jgi:hypothetical protein
VKTKEAILRETVEPTYQDEQQQTEEKEKLAKGEEIVFDSRENEKDEEAEVKKEAEQVQKERVEEEIVEEKKNEAVITTVPAPLPSSH